MVVTKILLRKGRTLPQKYSSVHINEHGVIPLWMVLKNTEDFHIEKLENGFVYNLDVSIWQRQQTQVCGENPEKQPNAHVEQPFPCRCEFSTGERKRQGAVVKNYGTLNIKGCCLEVTEGGPGIPLWGALPAPALS